MLLGRVGMIWRGMGDGWTMDDGWMMDGHSKAGRMI